MKTKLVVIALLLTSSISGQQIKVEELTPYTDKPKSVKDFGVTLKDKAEENFVCTYPDIQGGSAYDNIYLVDKHLNFLHEASYPDEYKKYKVTYLCRLGHHYIIELHKGMYKDTRLGLLDANLKLVKTIPYSGYGYEYVHTDGEYAYLHNGHQLQRFDESLNIVTSSDKFPTQLLISVSNSPTYITAWEQGDTLFFKKRQYLQLFEKSSLRRIGGIQFLSDNFGTIEYPGTHDILYGRAAAAEIWNSYAYYGMENGPTSFQKRYYNNKRLYVRLFDYQGNVLQLMDVLIGNDVVDATLTDDNKLLIARLSKTGQPQLTFMVLSADGVQSIEYGKIEDSQSFPMFLLDCTNNKAHLLIGTGNSYRVWELDLEKKTSQTIFNKQCNFDIGYPHISAVCHKWSNDAGYYLDFTQNLNISKDKWRDAETYDMVNTLIYVDKGYENSEIYHSSKLPNMNSYNINQLIDEKKSSNFGLLLHSEPRYENGEKAFSYYGLQYWLLDKTGHRKTSDVLCYYDRDSFRFTQSLQVSPTELYHLFNDKNQYKLVKVSIEE